MDEKRKVRRIRPQDRIEGHATPGMTREEAIYEGTMWAGFVRTDAGMTSAWHHHGDNRSAIYLLNGSLRLEYGPGGHEHVDAQPGDFIDVPEWAIHRELNPATETSEMLVFRSGEGPLVFNVEGPEPEPRAK